METQNYSNHTKVVPLFMFVCAPILILNLISSIYSVFQKGLSFAGAVAVLVAAALIVALLLGRMFALTVQDRVIRLEERLRFQQLLPDDLKPRIGEYTLDQLVSLRFASDAELPGLARKVLNEKLQDRKAIKRLIQVWRPDYLRA